MSYLDTGDKNGLTVLAMQGTPHSRLSPWSSSVLQYDVFLEIFFIQIDATESTKFVCRFQRDQVMDYPLTKRIPPTFRVSVSETVLSDPQISLLFCPCPLQISVQHPTVCILLKKCACKDILQEELTLMDSHLWKNSLQL